MHTMALDNTNSISNSPETCIAKSILKKNRPWQVANSLDTNKTYHGILQHIHHEQYFGILLGRDITVMRSRMVIYV